MQFLEAPLRPVLAPAGNSDTFFMTITKDRPTFAALVGAAGQFQAAREEMQRALGRRANPISWVALLADGEGICAWCSSRSG